MPRWLALLLLVPTLALAQYSSDPYDRVLDNGVELPRRRKINCIPAGICADDPVNAWTEIDMSGLVGGGGCSDVYGTVQGDATSVAASGCNDTLKIAGGTNGVDVTCASSAPDTCTLNFDQTEVTLSGGDLGGTLAVPTVDNTKCTGTAEYLDGTGTCDTLNGTVWIDEGQTAGGDLGGTYPNPTVDNTKCTGTSEYLDGTGTCDTLSSATWIDEGQAAGGDLGGTYPNPTVDNTKCTGTDSYLDGTGTCDTLNSTTWIDEGQSAGGDLTGTYPNPTVADADLIAIRDLASTAGMLSRTGAGAFAARTLTAPAAGFTITNPTGSGGNPTFVLADDLAGLEGMSGTGVAVHTGGGTWTERTITGTAGKVTVSNGTGVSGNPTITTDAYTSVLGFAACNSDSTDDSQEITDLITTLNAAGGGTVYIPDNTFCRVGSETAADAITPLSNVNIICGANAGFKAITGAVSILKATASFTDWRIEGCEFNLNTIITSGTGVTALTTASGATNAPADYIFEKNEVYGVSTSASAAHVLVELYCKPYGAATPARARKCVIANNFIKGSGSAAATTNDTCLKSNGPGNGVGFLQGPAVRVVNNTIGDCNGDGIAWANTSAVDGGFVIQGNSISDVKGSGIAGAIPYGVIIGNVISTHQTDGNDGMRFTGGVNVLIENNYVSTLVPASKYAIHFIVPPNGGANGMRVTANYAGRGIFLDAQAKCNNPAAATTCDTDADCVTAGATTCGTGTGSTAFGRYEHPEVAHNVMTSGTASGAGGENLVVENAINGLIEGNVDVGNNPASGTHNFIHILATRSAGSGPLTIANNQSQVVATSTAVVRCIYIEQPAGAASSMELVSIRGNTCSFSGGTTREGMRVDNAPTGTFSIADNTFLGMTTDYTGVPGSLTIASPTRFGGLTLGGSTSGTTRVNPTAAASGTLTLPAATDTLVGKATTDTFTNKTYDTAGAGNAFSINTNAITGVTGTGNTVALSAGPTFTGTVAMASATLSGTISTYNGVAKDASHSGVPLTGWTDTATAQSANIAANDFTTAISSATAGRYRLSCYVAVTRAASTSSTLPSCNLICTDPADSLAKTVLISTGANTGNTTGAGGSGVGICDAKVGTAIQWSTSGYASSGGTTMQYKVYVTLEVL